MRSLKILVVAVLMLGLLVPALAASDSEVQALRDQVNALTQQMKAMAAKLAELSAKLAAAEKQPAAKQPEKKAWYDKLSINGYFQNRYEARQDSTDDMFMRRMYLNFIGKPNSRTLGVLTFGRVGPDDPNVDLSVAMVKYQLNDLWSVTVGQYPTSFGFDAPESSRKRLPLERWVAGEGIPSRPDRPGLPGLFFKGPWDRGISFQRAQKGNAPWINIGVVNGNFREADDNNNKTVNVDLKWNKPWGSFGASYVDGKLGPSGCETDRNAVGFFFHTDPAPWGFQTEYLQGELFSKDTEGWYGQVAYAVNEKALPFVRYETYDPDTDLAGNTFHALHIGCQYTLDANNELTIEYIDANDLPIDYSQLGLQWQYGF